MPDEFVIKAREASLPVEQIRQPLTAILGRLDLALADVVRVGDEHGVTYGQTVADLRAAREAVVQLEAMCQAAVEAGKEWRA